MPCRGLAAAIAFLLEDASEFESLASALRDPSDGRMSVHPVDKIRAKSYYDRAQMLRQYATRLQTVTVECEDAKSVQPKNRYSS